MLGQASALFHTLLQRPPKAVHGRRCPEGTKIQLWPSSLTLYLQTAIERGCPRPQWSQHISLVKKRKKKCVRGWIIWITLFSSIDSESPYTFDWSSESYTPKEKQDTTAGMGVHTCVTLDCLGMSFRSSTFSPWTTLWSCLWTTSGSAALAALQKLWGSWKGVGGSNPAAVLHLSYHAHKENWTLKSLKQTLELSMERSMVSSIFL